MGVSPDRVKRTVIFDRKSDVTKKEQCYKVLSGEKSVTNGEQPYKGRTVLLMENNLTKERQCYKWRTKLQRENIVTKYYQGRKALQMENNVTKEGQCYKWRTRLQRENNVTEGEQCYTGRKQRHRKENGNVLARENRDTT